MIPDSFRTPADVQNLFSWRLLPRPRRRLTRLALVGFRLSRCQLGSRLVIGEVAEHLHSSGILLGGEHSVVLIDKQPRDGAEVSGQCAVTAHPHQKFALWREALQHVE